MSFNRVAVAGLLLGVAACTSVRSVKPDAYLAVNNPDVVWVTHINKTVVPVAQPEIAGDTLRGMWLGTQRPVAIPLGDIQRFQAKVPDHMKTAFFVTAGLAGFVASVWAIWISKAGSMTAGVDCGTYGSSTQGPVGAPIPYC